MMKKAWLVQWGFYAPNEEECLKRFGIREKVIDVISARKKFDKQIVEMAKDIYKREALSFSEKVFLSNYSKGKSNWEEFFGSQVPVSTHYQSDTYSNLIKAINENGLSDKKVKKLLAKWGKHPVYVKVGHNPHLEIRKVFNLFEYWDDDGKEVLEWNYPLPNGNTKKGKYKSKK